MRMDEARERCRNRADLHAFISLGAEPAGTSVIAVKDLIDVRGMVTTAGSIMLPSKFAEEDAAVVQRARSAGCAVIGKTNLYEWAYGATGANPHYGHVRNPTDPTKTAGGSSGGSAAAVAARLCDWAIGTDTAGSIRVPAALCGVVGYKPTFGLLPTTGVMPLATSLDTVGALAPTVHAAAAAIALMAERPGLAQVEARTLSDFHLATPARWVDGLDDPTTRVWHALSRRLPEVRLPSRNGMSQHVRTIQRAEAAAHHRRWLAESPSQYSRPVLERLHSGLKVSAVDYLTAVAARSRIQEAVESTMTGIDAILLPTTAIVAPGADEPEAREPLLRFTAPFSLTGQPVISLPAPVEGMPVGIQVIGRRGCDETVISVASALATSWEDRRS
jgi:Asp-tRNA(Asn)/Glu-tRNA(Gln) amidotransferase A subunit family amidase